MATPTPQWTIDELGAQVALALTTDYPGPPNQRVREVPDRRTIRYYTTLGLIDRPAEMRGRTAFYGPRHLWQLVAIKRLQARGLSLAEIQERLVGQTDATLRRLAQLPRGEAWTPPAAAGPQRRTEAFWTAAPASLPESLEQQGQPNAVVAGLESMAGVAPDPRGRPLQALPLTEDVLLVWAPIRDIQEEDQEAICVAAAPLLKLLEARRLIGPRPERGNS